MRVLLTAITTLSPFCALADHPENCHSYEELSTSSISIQLARGITDSLPTAGRNTAENVMHVAEFDRQRSTFPNIADDPLFFLSWSYRFALSEQLGVSAGLAEHATKALIKGDFCEEEILFALISTLRYRISNDIAGSKVLGYFHYANAFHNPPVDFQLENFNAAVCWMKSIKGDLLNYRTPSYYACLREKR